MAPTKEHCPACLSTESSLLDGPKEGMVHCPECNAVFEKVVLHDGNKDFPKMGTLHTLVPVPSVKFASHSVPVPVQSLPVHTTMEDYVVAQNRLAAAKRLITEAQAAAERGDTPEFTLENASAVATTIEDQLRILAETKKTKDCTHCCGTGTVTTFARGDSSTYAHGSLVPSTCQHCNGSGRVPTLPKADKTEESARDNPNAQTVHFEWPTTWTSATGAVRSKESDGYRYDLIPQHGLQRVAATCDEGAKKYAPHNYKKGFPYSVMVNHALIHLAKYLLGDRSEDHLAHACWNLLALMDFEAIKPDMNDIPERNGPCPPKSSSMIFGSSPES